MAEWLSERGNAAGEGAARQAQRATDRAERLRRELLQAERRAQYWAIGAAGERQVAQVLEGAGWTALHDQPWPGRPRANLDHVVIAGSQVCIIDTKTWSGTVTVTGGQLRQNGRSRMAHLYAAQEATVAVANRLNAFAQPGSQPEAIRVWPVVCFVGSGANLAPTHVRGVILVGIRHLARWLGESPAPSGELLDHVKCVRMALARAPSTTPAPHHISRRTASLRPVPPPQHRGRRRRRDPSWASCLLTLAVMVGIFALVANVDVVTTWLSPVVTPWIEEVLNDNSP